MADELVERVVQQVMRQFAAAGATPAAPAAPAPAADHQPRPDRVRGHGYG